MRDGSGYGKVIMIHVSPSQSQDLHTPSSLLRARRVDPIALPVPLELDVDTI
jgi:hypothetical protein